MNRQQQAKGQMKTDPARAWKPVEISVGMNCAPSIARAAMDGLVQAGECVRNPQVDTYTLMDVRAAILAHLHANPAQEFTAIGIVEALPELHLIELRAMRFLSDLEAADQCIAFYSVEAV